MKNRRTIMTIPIEAIQEKNKVNVLTDRVKKLDRTCLDAEMWISSKRARSFTESWKKSQAEANNIRWSLAIAQVLDDSPIVIRDNELIVASETKYIKGAEIAPEQNPHDIVMQLESEKLVTMSEVMYTNIEDEEKEGALETAKYWQGQSLYDVVKAQRERQVGPDFWKLMGDGVRVFTDSVGVTGKNQALFNPVVIEMGFEAIIERAKNERDKVHSSWNSFPPNPRELYHKIDILEGIIIVCEAIVRFAKKHAVLAREMAEKEADPTRKQELLEIAERCEHVPAKPARTFAEALQAFWFTSLAFKKESAFPSGPCPGLMDRWLNPFLSKGVEDGTLTYQQAAELLGCMWVKLNEVQCFHGFFFLKRKRGFLTTAGNNRRYELGRCGRDKCGVLFDFGNLTSVKNASTGYLCSLA
jgi:formate C-acetyltransferase